MFLRGFPVRQEHEKKHCVVSQQWLTFPTYFLKEDIVEQEFTLIDALIFKNYFMEKLNIAKRYVGTESKEKMNDYNKTLKTILEDKLVLVDRIGLDNQIISASHVRKLLHEGNIEEALKYIPQECYSIFKLMAYGKYSK